MKVILDSSALRSEKWQLNDFQSAQPSPVVQVRLWPLDPRFRRDETSPQAEAGWRHAKLRYPVGAVVSARVASVFPSDCKYWITFTSDDETQRWSGTLLQWTGEQPVVGKHRAVSDTGAPGYHRRIIATPAD